MLDINTLLFLGGSLFLIGILASTFSTRLGMPLLLLFLVLGMVAGEEGLGGIRFDDFQLAFVVANLSLAIILLDGGLRTKIATFRAGLRPASVLATWGVVATAGSVGAFATWLLGVDWRLGLLLGAIVGSTDAAAVFNLLRHSDTQLNDRVGSTLEIESGANDPMAVFLVLLLLEVLTAPGELGAPDVVIRLIQQFGIGIVAGLLGGMALSWLVWRMHLAEGLYALLVASGGIVVFAAVNHLGGSGFLAIYLTGLLVGNRRARAAEHVMRVMDGLAWLAQAGMFLMLGLLVTPSQLTAYAAPALMIAAFLIFVARPVAIVTGLLPFRFPAREVAYISWVGLRGAVPIVLAMFPIMMGLDDAGLLFDITFVVVLASLLIQGSTVPIMARWLGVQVPYRAKPLDSRELWIGRDSTLELLSFRVEEDSPAVGAKPEHMDSWHLRGLQCINVIRHGRRLKPTDSLFYQVDDVVWLLAEPGQTDDIARYFSHQDRKGELAAANFFGEFVLNGDSPAADLAMVYGLELSERQRDGTIADLINSGKGRRVVVGDRVALGSVRLTVRAMEAGRITSVGLKIVSH